MMSQNGGVNDEEDYEHMDSIVGRPQPLPASPTVNRCSALTSPGSPSSPGRNGRPGPPTRPPPRKNIAHSTLNPTPKPAETPPPLSAAPPPETTCISLHSLATTHNQYLPQRIQLLRPALNVLDESVAKLHALGGVCDVHFGHCWSTVTARSLSGSPSFVVPLNSSIRFGLLYEPKEERKVTIDASFVTVSDILDALPMPKVVCAQKTYVGSTLDKTVSAGEILSVLSIATSDDGCRCLNVYSFLRKREIVLPFFCTGNFTTSPSKVQLHMRDIVERIKDPFPSKACPFAENEEMAKCFSVGFFSNAVSLVEQGETHTVIVTPVQALDSPGTARGKEVEILADEKIIGTILPLSADAMETLRFQTNTLKENYDERKISYVLQASTNEKDRDQAQLFRHVLPAYAKQEEPSKATLTTLQGKYEVLADDVRSIRADMKVMQSQIAALAESLAHAAPLTAPLAEPTSTPIEKSDILVEKNKNFLRTLSLNQVLSLLSSMEMDQYREAFAAERVDGKIFAELDEAVLEKDLQITSSTDRLKLVMVINGQLRP